jgi:hypothetical protein
VNRITRRDPWPVALASVTALVSCGLLALAILRGWLGKDAGRGANFCEAARDSLVLQPANTFSNAGFVAAGLLIAWHSSLRENLGSVLSAHRRLATAMACIVVFLGPASAAMHATQSENGGHLDMLSMYLVASFASAYAAMRWFRGGVTLFTVCFASGVVFCEIIGLSAAMVPVVGHSGNAAFALLLLLAIGLEVLIWRRAQTRAVRTYAIGSLAAMTTAFVIWNATKTWLCDPGSLIQGHAIWHLLCAVSAYLLYRYYASEQDR